MRAIGVTAFGGPDALQVVDLPEPHAEDGEIRIAVRAATVNPTDVLRRSGALASVMTEPPPYVPGMEVAGVVDEIGENTVTDLSVGDAVMAIVVPRGSAGAYAEHVVVPADSAVRCPRGASFAEAATLPMNGLTARLALDMLALEPGQTLAVTGAAGALGGYVIQLAGADGLRVVADASTNDEPLVRELGADLVVARGDEVAARIRAAVHDGVDGLVDAALLHTASLPAIRDAGGLASVRAFEGESERGIVIHRVAVPHYATNREALDGLRQLVEDGVVTLRVADTVAASAAADAHRRLEAGGVRGRLVLDFAR